MTVIDKMENKDIRQGSEIAWQRAFIEKLGDPSKWVYTGVCTDAAPAMSHCICGEQIRWCFEIAYNGRTEIVGSVCIDHFSEINPSLYADLMAANETLKDRLAEAKHKSKQAEQEAQLAPLKADWESLVERYKKACEYYRQHPVSQNRPFPSWLFWLWLPKCPQYQRVGDFVRWYTKHLAKDGVDAREFLDERGF